MLGRDHRQRWSIQIGSIDGLRQVVEKRREVVIAPVKLISDALEFIRIDVTGGKRRLAGAGRAADPRDRTKQALI